MIHIRRNSIRYRLWKKANDKKKFERNLASKEKRKRRRRINLKYGTPDDEPEIIEKIFNVPKVFSIINNPEETIAFFNLLIGEIDRVRKSNTTKRKAKKEINRFFLEMDNTIEITGDALMYLLSILKNSKGKKKLPIIWEGDFPQKERMKDFLINSGYLKYMKTKQSNLVKTNNHIQIQTGSGYEYEENGESVDIRQKIIDFTCKKMDKDKVHVNFLMTMLTEMITNIIDHAYEDGGMFEPSWYIFVENNEDELCYTFMDNGVGIPTTIKKYAHEKIAEIFSADREYKYIEAGVSGLEKRSKTGKIERGNGLPSIYEQYTEKKVSKLVIISNNAYFEENNSRDLRNCLYGTIFYWKIKKEAI